MNNKIKDLKRDIEKLNNKEFFVLHISNGKNVVDWAFNKNDRIEKISERIRKELKFGQAHEFELYEAYSCSSFKLKYISTFLSL